MSRKENQQRAELEKRIHFYTKWLREDCSDISGEVEWLVHTLLDSEHFEDMQQVLNDTYENYNN